MTTDRSATTSRLKAILREPALLIDAAESLLILLVALGLSINGEQQNYIVAFLIALAGLAKGITTRPFPASVIPDFGRAGLVLAVAFGLADLSADQIAIAVTFLGTLMTVIMRGQITPTHDPVVDAHGSGSGPVSGEAGFIEPSFALMVGAIGVAMALVAPSVWLALGVGVLLAFAFVVAKKNPMYYRRR